jgi:hypothetical protein
MAASNLYALVHNIVAVTYLRILSEGLRGTGSRNGDNDSSSCWVVTIEESIDPEGRPNIDCWLWSASISGATAATSGAFLACSLPAPNNSVILLLTKLVSLSLLVPSGIEKFPRDII